MEERLVAPRSCSHTASTRRVLEADTHAVKFEGDVIAFEAACLEKVRESLKESPDRSVTFLIDAPSFEELEAMEERAPSSILIRTEPVDGGGRGGWGSAALS